MKVFNITFSPTGGTQKVANLIADEFFCEKENISLISNKEEYSSYKFSKEDICIIAVPSFGGRVPSIAVARLLNMEGNGARCVLVCVYGNRAYEDTLMELKNTVKKAGFYPVAAIAAIAEHSIMRNFAAGRPDSEDCKQIKCMAKKIADTINTKDFMKEVIVPGNETYREFGGVPFIPKTTNKCISCGKCVNECPVGAIDVNNPKKTDKEKCISCMRCIAICPQKAKKLDGLVLKVAADKMAKAFEIRKENQLFLEG